MADERRFLPAELRSLSLSVLLEERVRVGVLPVESNTTEETIRGSLKSSINRSFKGNSQCRIDMCYCEASSPAEDVGESIRLDNTE